MDAGKGKVQGQATVERRFWSVACVSSALLLGSTSLAFGQGPGTTGGPGVEAETSATSPSRRKGPRPYSGDASAGVSAVQPLAAEPFSTILDPIVVQDERGTGPASGIVADITATASKTDTPIVEIPQAVSVVGRAQMDQQNALSVGDSLRYTPGVYADSRLGGVLESVFMRGFGGVGVAATSPQFYNGLPLVTGSGAAAQVVDPWTLERVEVLRGPASVLYGVATPGGIVNLISKEPTETPYREIGIETGNRDRAQATFDFAGPVTKDSQWSYRLTGLARRADTQIDFSKEQRVVLAPTLSWKPDDDTSLTVFGYYQNDPDNNFAGWLPANGTTLPNPAGRIPRDFFLGEPSFDEYSRQQYMLGYRFEHRFDDAWAVRQNVRYTRVDAKLKGLVGNFMAPFGATSSSLNRLATWSDETLDGVALDNQVEYQVDTGSLRHTLLGGLSYQRSVDANKGSGFALAPPIDYLAPTYGDTFAAPPLATSTRQTLDRVGVYLQDQIRVDQWAFTLGARSDWSSSKTRDRLTGAVQDQSDQAFSGRAGAVYLFDNGLAPYASYSTSFEPTVGVNAGGKAYEPSKARQAEIGLRYQPEDWDGLLSASLFDIRRTNVSVTDPSNPLYNIQTGEVRSRGLELEARAAVNGNLDLIAAYTYLDTTVLENSDRAIVGNRLIAVPEHMASLWANYTFTDGGFDGLSLGAGMRYIGKSAGDDANSFSAPSATLVDAALTYDLGASKPELEGWRASLNVNNLFDKSYVASCFSKGGCFYGNGRVITGGLRYRW